MKPRRLVFPVMLVGFAGIAAWTQLGRSDSGAHASLVGMAASRLAETPVAVPTMASQRNWSPASAGRQAAATGKPIALSGEATAIVAEEVVLQQLAAGSSLALTAQQWTDFAEVVRDAQAVRQAYEATIAKATVLERGRYRLEIPMYPGAGDALRVRFYSDLTTKLGAPLAAEIERQLGGALEGQFGGFGVSAQTLDFAADASGAESDYAVTRTLRYWNSVEGADRVTLRRETHFPGLEDPSGQTWGPFLSVLAERLAEKAGS